MKFLGKRFIPVDNIKGGKAIFIVGEASDGMTRYVALIDLYNPNDRWVETMSITNVSTDPEAQATPTFMGALRHISDDEEWRTAVALFGAHKVFEEYNVNELEKNIVDTNIRQRLTPYNDWWFDRKQGVDNVPTDVNKVIEDYKTRFKIQLDRE